MPRTCSPDRSWNAWAGAFSRSRSRWRCWPGQYGASWMLPASRSTLRWGEIFSADNAGEGDLRAFVRRTDVILVGRFEQAHALVFAGNEGRPDIADLLALRGQFHPTLDGSFLRSGKLFRGHSRQIAFHKVHRHLWVPSARFYDSFERPAVNAPYTAPGARKARSRFRNAA